jgi:hypothetical protein
MNAKIRTADEAVPAMLDAEFLANMPMMLNLITDFGILGLTFEPSGSLHGYADWSADASSDADARPCLLTSAEKKIAEGGADVVRRLIDGEALAGNVPGTVGLAPYHDAEVRVPEEVKQQAAQVVEQLSQGTLTTGVDF